MVAAMYADDAVTIFADGGVNLGREEIEAGVTAVLAGSPTLSLERGELHVAGDQAVARGGWSIETAVEGADPVVVSGNYMTWFARVDGDWKINVVASNYDSPQPPEAYMGEVSPNVDDEEDYGLDGLMTAYEASWAAGDVAALGMLYTEDAYVSYADQSAIEGRAAVEAVLAERVSGTLDIHAKGTFDLGDGWAVNGGWYETTRDDGATVGNYLLLASTADDGSAQIHWLVGNGRPFPEE
jgi:ketosteroid isomerase-like protein